MINPLIDYSQPYMEGYRLFWFGGDKEDCSYKPGSCKEQERISGFEAAERINKGNKDGNKN